MWHFQLPSFHHTTDQMSQWCLFLFFFKKKTKKTCRNSSNMTTWGAKCYAKMTVTQSMINERGIHRGILKIEIKILQRCLHEINNMAKDDTISYQREKTKVHCNKRKTAKCWGKYIYLLHLSCFPTIKYRPLSYHSRLCPNVACKNTKKIDIS